MKLSVPSRFEPELLDALKALSNFEAVGEVYGSLPYSIVGHGRVSDLVARFGEFGFERVKEFTSQAHSIGLGVNYLANSLCLGELPFDREGRGRITHYIEEVVETGVDKITVATPYLLRLVKSEFPDLKVQVSVYAHVDNLQKFRRWEELGADVINLPAIVNRDFTLLREIAGSPRRAEVELLVNESCLFHCPYALYHHTVSSHRSKMQPEGILDYCILECTLDRLERPAEILRAPWIRPEDLAYYEGLGVEWFKVQGRQMPIGWILRTVAAYSERSYKGNLMDLISPTYPDWSARSTVLKEVAARSRVDSLKPPSIYIDNSLLDGFFKTLVDKGGCGDLQECGLCRYCDRAATELIQIRDPGQFEAYLSATKMLFKELMPAGLGSERL